MRIEREIWNQHHVNFHSAASPNWHYMFEQDVLHDAWRKRVLLELHARKVIFGGHFSSPEEPTVVPETARLISDRAPTLAGG